MKIVFKSFPLPMHQYARQAATAALAAYHEGKFRAFHERLFKAAGALSNENIQAIAKDLKLGMKKFNHDMHDPAIQSIIYRDMNEGQRAGVRGTPTIFINGKLLRLRTLQFKEIDDAVEEELKK